MNRLDAIRRLVQGLIEEPVIANLGHCAYDLYSVSDRLLNFYTWGSMGMASSIGLGLALARPDRRVVVIDGDGSLLMNLGSLATIAWQRPANLVLLVMDNEQHATTGGQGTATAHGADLEAAARALGIRRTATVKTLDELETTLDETRRSPGPWFIVAKVEEARPTLKPPLDCVFLKQRFMVALGNPEEGTRGGPA